MGSAFILLLTVHATAFEILKDQQQERPLTEGPDILLARHLLDKEPPRNLEDHIPLDSSQSFVFGCKLVEVTRTKWRTLCWILRV